ncbi:MAG: corrinoid ABC transporter substrate-binding protein [Methanosaeta sp. PtaU1.Bin055]|nr:MAG: corrinoid ABC transporter substrate-binding protein [Methanosaeta sp. PtaU1.Bin055]
MNTSRIAALMMLLASIMLLTEASAVEDDFTLNVFGNANMDEALDEEDIEYVHGIIEGTNEVTELADANYDGDVDGEDIAQIEQIIDGEETELTLIDSADRTVTVKKPITRIVPTFPQAIETLRTLKVPKDHIVGIGTWPTPLDTAFFPEFVDVPSIGTGWDPNVEEILALHPDVVLLFGRGGVSDLDSVQEVLESADITVLRFKLQTPETYREEVKTLGYVFGRDEAEEYLDWHEEILKSIEERVDMIPDEDKPKVYFAPSFKEGEYYIYGRYAYIETAGGLDTFADQPDNYVSINPEAIMAQSPDIIVLVAPWTAGGYDLDASNTSDLEGARNEILSQPEMQNVKAVKDGQVYVIADHLVAFFPASGCRQIIQLAYQAKWFHPELFEDLDPKAIHQEYLTRFQGLDIDLDENGVFVYPLEETT